MAKRNKNKKKSTNNSSQNNAESDKQTADNLESKLEEIIINNEVTPDEIAQIDIMEEDNSNPTYKSAKDLYHNALQIEKVLEKRKTEYEKLKEKLKEEQSQLNKEKEGAVKLKTDLKEQLDKYNEELIEINQLRIDGGWASVIDKKLLDNYDEQLKKQEEVLSNKITELNTKHTEYITLLSDLETKKLDQETEIKKLISNKKSELEEVFKDRFNEKENKLVKLSNELESSKRLLDKKQKELNYQIEDFEDDKIYLTDKAKKQVKEEIEDLNQQIINLTDKNNALQNSLHSLKEELQYLGDKSAEDVVSKLRDQEKTIFELREKLETSPGSINMDDLKRLQKEKNDWQNKIGEINAQLSEYKSRYENQKLQIGEKERLEFQKEELELRIKLQQAALEELKYEVNDLTKESEDKVTFVSCSDMDKKFSEEPFKALQNTISKGWINNIQQAIAQVTVNELYYDRNTLRSFIAGLSMSRFSILQGISGTGKTSLPKAFAESIGGNYGIVEVQSGWKDRQDLIGYYNTFEKKYYEGKFLKLLYKAGTPKYSNKPFFIILDEMNLSHPEHYFADMLSIMEETNPDKQILTVSDKVKDIPKLMLELSEGDIGLKIPQNVWFIGTANHDETTLQFAPKTYDRANILEMPINNKPFEIKSIDKSKVQISNDAFLGFMKDSKFIDDNVEGYLNGDFKTICNKLGIGWGNRLQKQIELFTPVFIALDGSIADALDHIIASKILRSIKGRYDLQEPTLKEMKDELDLNFNDKFNGFAKKSLKIVNKELSRFN
ncbi:AAA family ATPase [Psychroserpens sp. NJDZ02]|uniref:AAA family ATPase n=1 Tax=Psychroserpens sp. NJDZ02 TaxID=2570561 RepID=UPI0010A8AD9A|nr:AAA family ATPase [Psychroserpens sp. NJDZ02]QCE42405.1 AAA family ATPase [Psychroserpens sp. NJDZ02]